MRGFKRACAVCGEKFYADNRLHTHCEDCRQPNGPKRFRQQEQERLWATWLIRQLEPFLGKKHVSVNEIILHLREQASKGRAA
jgi:hypothetical protein